MTLQTKVYNSAVVSRLEPSREQLCQAKAFRDAMRKAGFLIVYSMAKNEAELVPMLPAVLKREGITQKKLTSEDKALFLRLRDVLSIQVERTWLRTGLEKAEAVTPKRHRGNCVSIFDETLRLFSGSRLVERRQGNFIDEAANWP